MNKPARLYMRVLFGLHKFTEDELETDHADAIRDYLLGLWRGLPSEDEWTGRLLSRTMNAPITWKRSKSMVRIDRSASPLDKIEWLEAHREHFNAPVFWKTLGSLWREAGWRFLAKECHRRWTLAKSANTKGQP